MLPPSACFQKAGTLPLMETELTNEALMTKRTEGFSLFCSFEEKIPLNSPECHSVLQSYSLCSQQLAKPNH